MANQLRSKKQLLLREFLSVAEALFSEPGKRRGAHCFTALHDYLKCKLVAKHWLIIGLKTKLNQSALDDAILGGGVLPPSPPDPPLCWFRKGSAPQTPHGLNFRVQHLSTSEH